MPASTPLTSASEATRSSLEGRDGALRRLNLTAAALHAGQAVAMVALSNSLALPVTAAFATGPPGQPERPPVIEELFSYRLGLAVALFSALSALFHLIVATAGQRRYLNDLRRGLNRHRWIEYSLSASLMIVLIAGITGITDVAALLALAGVNAAMILFGWLMETTNPRRPAHDWSPFVFGCIAGAVPWLAIGIYLVGAGSDVPGFVYGIFVSIFILFNCFAINQALQYRAVGRWQDYLFGERTYIWLSFIAKSLLAWQIFANVLV
jgi:hypothetical protein